MHSAQTEGKSKVMKEKQIFINIKSKKKDSQGKSYSYFSEKREKKNRTK